MAKTLEEILSIAQDRDSGRIPELSCRELEVLYFELNRTRYKLEEQEEFVRFFMVVHEALVDCRQGYKNDWSV